MIRAAHLRREVGFGLLLAAISLFGSCSLDSGGWPDGQATWRTLEPGLELGIFRAPRPAEVGDSLIRVLRIDPQRFALRLLNASAPDQGSTLTPRQWCDRNGLVAAINASMYQQDYRTSVSLMRTAAHVNNPRLTRDKTVLAFDARDPQLPPVSMIDLECDTFDESAGGYGSLVQSIRMLSCTGENVWQQQPRRSSTAAIGIDRRGRVLFVHVRSPFSTHDLIDMLVGLPLELHRLMYAEGGPEAQLFMRGPDREYEFVGVFDPTFDNDDSNKQAWPVPNVVGVTRRRGSRR